MSWLSRSLGVLFCLTILIQAGAEAVAAGADTPSIWPRWARRLESEMAPLQQLEKQDAGRWERLPTIHAAERGVPLEGAGDASDLIQSILREMKGGGTLVLDPGRYRQTRCLSVWNDNIRILGTGATLVATNPDDLCLEIGGNGFTLRGLTLEAAMTVRGLGTKQARIVLNGDGAVIAGNTIRGATSAGIWVQGATNFAIVDNVVTATKADGIHHSEGSRRGYVARNTVDMTGDDGIAVVSYRSSARCGRVLIENNKVSNVKTARGIAVVGSQAVIVRNNIVDGTGRAAGIIVTREPSYDTYGVSDIIVADNEVKNVTARFGLPDKEMTGQASIDLNAYEAPTEDLQVRRVVVAANRIDDGKTGGVRLLQGVCEISVLDNQIGKVEGSPIAVVEPKCQPVLAGCASNRVGTKMDVPPGCTEALP